jgi:hypothetical protein
VFPGAVYNPADPRGFLASDFVSFNYFRPLLLCGSFPVQDESLNPNFKVCLLPFLLH